MIEAEIVLAICVAATLIVFAVSATRRGSDHDKHIPQRKEGRPHEC